MLFPEDLVHDRRSVGLDAGRKASLSGPVPGLTFSLPRSHISTTRSASGEWLMRLGDQAQRRFLVCFDAESPRDSALSACSDRHG